MEPEMLTDREQRVLEAIVRNFILSAAPTSSRYLSKQNGFEISAASIRNVMGDLEDRGFITQPHTSAGRVPTDKGYRYYVDRMMGPIDLPEQVKQSIRNSIVTIDQADLHLLMEAASKALSRATNQLGVILAPKLRKGVFRTIHVFSVGNGRYLMNVAIDSGFVKTMVVELHTELSHDRLVSACNILNARFSGKTLAQMCEDHLNELRDVGEVELGVIKLLVPSLRKIIEENEQEEVYADGETNVILQPEFFSRDRIGAVIEILEEKRLLMHLFEAENRKHSRPEVVISIGGENSKVQLRSFSIIKTTYKVGSMTGSLGVIGPKRMPYPQMVSAVSYTAKLLGELYT
ncbi:heat-inducible transcriptional repressor HrcA [Chitinispirillales bacterium ANBcel5]|uniref:heat-inducible transcriptional repressor HrcA n=1 Tax=Cellulosispirillum alkaliphilum TaxID=3039283 RepID=UPI002A50B79A|nr:heat-inducible transcriptional repressor HrcA [Chitinispirillales bacterium ANBcel5]